MKRHRAILTAGVVLALLRNLEEADGVSSLL